MKKEILKILIDEFDEFREEATQLHYDPSLSLEDFIEWLKEKWQK